MDLCAVGWRNLVSEAVRILARGDANLCGMRVFRGRRGGGARFAVAHFSPRDVTRRLGNGVLVAMTTDDVVGVGAGSAQRDGRRRR